MTRRCEPWWVALLVSTARFLFVSIPTAAVQAIRQL